MVILEGVFVIFAISLPLIVFTLVMTGDIDTKSIKTKIKDFFYRKSEKDNPSPVYREENDDFKTFENELKNLDLEIEYVQKLNEMEKQKKDKKLRLKRLYANEEEFETLYIVYKNVVHYRKDVEKIFQTKVEAVEFAQTLNIEGFSYGIVEEFKYLPNKEEENAD